MSFTTQIKDEITKLFNNKIEDLISLLVYLKFNSNITDYKISIFTENASVARWLFKLIKVIYDVPIKLTIRTINRFKKRNIYILEIKDKKDIILLDINNTLKNISDASNEEKIAFLKGMFLSCGSVNDPKKNKYHLEFFVKSESDALLVNSLLLDLGLFSKVLKREKEFMVYIKKSENIGDFINYLGAVNALFYFEDIRIYKDHKNMVNRLNNCEQANIEKSLKSSREIILNIEYLEDNDLINLLDDRAREIINYKKKYPETSMGELAHIISLETSKPITKSGINHHFRQINELVNKHSNN